MAIRFQPISLPSSADSTANVAAPVDGGIIVALPKIDNFGNADASNIGNAKKRGRPRSGNALTPAEKQRRYRERQRAARGYTPSLSP